MGVLLLLLAPLLVWATVVVYLRRFRPWQLRWGAADAEVSRSLPGDDLLDAPTFNATRAITIDARPENVWSWLLQETVKRKQSIRIMALDKPLYMISGTPGQATWSWALVPLPDGSTRLVARVRAVYHWLSPTILFSMLIEFADIWMTRRLLLKVKASAEGLELTQILARRLALGR